LTGGEKDEKSKAISERFTRRDRGMIPDNGSGLKMDEFFPETIISILEHYLLLIILGTQFFLAS